MNNDNKSKPGAAAILLWAVIAFFAGAMVFSKGELPPKAVGAGFALLGALLFIYPIALYIRNKRVCTLPVSAVCTGIDSITRRNRRRRVTLYAPVWEFYLDGSMHKVKEQVYSTIGVPEIGDVTELMVNPMDPGDFARKNSLVSYAGLLAVGFIFAAVGTCVFLFG